MRKFKLANRSLTSFDASVEGVDPITFDDDVEVPAGKVEAVLEAAERSGVRLVEIDDATGEAEPAVNATDGALRVAEEEGIDLSAGEVEGTLDGGRISQQDVEKYVQARDDAKAASATGS